MLQTLGQGIRNYNENYWVNIMLDELDFISYHSGFNQPTIIISDVRYPNEITELEKLFDVVKIRIERPSFNNGLTQEQQQHSSETALDSYESWDYVVVNDGDLEEYKEKIRRIIENESKDN